MSKILKYKKIIMLALILVGVIICVFAAYITEYNKTKIDVETLFTEIEEDREYKDSEEFFKNYEYFHIYAEDIKKAHLDQKENTVSGSYTLKVVSKDNTIINAKAVSISAVFAANWVGFQSEVKSTSNYKSSKEATIKISNITQLFPAKGKLLFTKVEEPTLYVMIKWSDNSGERYYTYLELDYETYSQVPTLPVEPTATPEHNH